MIATVLRPFIIPLLLLSATPLLAQRPVLDSARAERAATVVSEFIAAASVDELSATEVERYATGSFAERMKPVVGRRAFAAGMPHVVRSVQMVNGADSILSVAVTSIADTLPVFGPLAVELTFFVHLDSTGWRISDMRRFARVEQVANEIRTVNAAKEYPPSLKPIIIREVSSVLLSNHQLRENFLENAEEFRALVSRFDGTDSLTILGRVDHNVQQLNRVALDWGEAAHTIPKEVVDEYIASASPNERTKIRSEIKRVEKLRLAGRDSLAKYARRYKLSVPRLDETVELMQRLRVTFINAELPWKGVVQLTVGGVIDDAIGYLYTPTGEMPLISSDEFYYLEDIGDGWWIFRAG